jgi:hypothetical protein
MTEHEVRALMDPWAVSRKASASDGHGHELIRVLYWEDSRNEFAVKFSSEEGKVLSKEASPPPRRISLLDVLRDWLSP